MIVGTYAGTRPCERTGWHVPGCHVYGRGHAQGTTAHYLTHSTFPIKSGDTALVHARRRRRAARDADCAAARRDGLRHGRQPRESCARAQAGAAATIDYLAKTEAEIKKLTNGRGVDVV